MKIKYNHYGEKISDVIRTELGNLFAMECYGYICEREDGSVYLCIEMYGGRTDDVEFELCIN